jgi:hypothetical protein
MQSAALFASTLLLALSNGQLYEQVLLELVASAGTFLVLRRLGAGRWVAAGGGSAFALNGTFAWLANAPINPVAFLPLLLLGIEQAHDAALHARRGGWWLIALALALSIYAGFPETAHIDGLMGVAWLLWRCAQGGRARIGPLLLKASCGLAAGMLLVAPLLVAFLAALPHEFTGVRQLGNSLQLPQL